MSKTGRLIICSRLSSASTSRILPRKVIFTSIRTFKSYHGFTNGSTSGGSGTGASSNSKFKSQSQSHFYSTQTQPSPPQLKDDEPDPELASPNLRSRTSTIKKPKPNEQSQAPLILDANPAGWTQLLHKYGPLYKVHGSQVRIIKDPKEFYQALLTGSKNASKRITFASLYLGTGKLEQKLVDTIEANLQNNSDLRVKILLDCTRGSRGTEKNSRTMLLPLIGAAPEPVDSRCSLYLYHTPTLRGARKKILPQRWNELIGLQHMKLYIFDNDILISGANLSNDYFTNRQDRYFLIKNCENLADFYDGLISQVGKFSFQVNQRNELGLDPNWSIHPSNGDSAKFISKARKNVELYYEGCKFQTQSNPTGAHENQDTWIFPIIQMGPFGINYDDQATSQIFQKSARNSLIRLATGYFNLTSDYIDTIIWKSVGNYEILMAHPKANGFLGSSFPAGGIPAAYTLLASRFFREVQNSEQASRRIQMWEFIKPFWTFHAKGLWFYPPGESLPLVTLVGSPNFGYRSVYRDLETQLYIITLNPTLRQKFDEEQKHLYKEAEQFNDRVFSEKDRIVPLWVHMVIKFFKNFF